MSTTNIFPIFVQAKDKTDHLSQCFSRRVMKRTTWATRESGLRHSQGLCFLRHNNPYHNPSWSVCSWTKWKRWQVAATLRYFSHPTQREIREVRVRYPMMIYHVALFGNHLGKCRIIASILRNVISLVCNTFYCSVMLLVNRIIKATSILRRKAQ